MAPPLLWVLWALLPGPPLPPPRHPPPGAPGLRARYRHLQSRLRQNQTWGAPNPEPLVRVLTPQYTERKGKGRARSRQPPAALLHHRSPLQLGSGASKPGPGWGRGRGRGQRYRAQHRRARCLPGHGGRGRCQATARLQPDGLLHLLVRGAPPASRLHRALLRAPATARSSRDVTRPLRRQLHLRGPRAAVLRLRAPHNRTLQGRPRLELHWRAPAGRGRRGAQAQDGCPLGAGRCCRLLSLRATLEELGWADWVLAPRELDVRMCAGACPSRFRSANTHAQMQARLHGRNPDAAPAPCCVPAAYEPVVLMHKDSAGRVALTPFDDLVASDCHCA
ncbi:growth/differentiation factor 15 isoform X1 [Erinaceus europaeus]|uniref:Growth/differentiation factor 15 isoform X1 n=1 Tax=Erinaceus europaeus TaxID=9365 RepID=A0ABM3WP67_ERIEU|nr:growth/differentiation factor 15 isoform X1 [Erinaceus europaeus]